MLVTALFMLMLILVGCASPTQPTVATETVDVLDYVIGDPALWPRHGEPNHHQHQNLEPNRVCWTKYTLGWSYECWRWDDYQMYHDVDHAIDGRRWEYYRFTDGRWLPRHLVSGTVWTLDVATNRIRWVDAECQAQPDRDFPYKLRAWLEPAVATGGDLGVRDVLVLEYEPYDSRNPQMEHPERFYFAKGAGWYRWTGADGSGVTFNRVGGVARTPTPLCARDFQASFRPSSRTPLEVEEIEYRFAALAPYLTN